MYFRQLLNDQSVRLLSAWLQDAPQFRDSRPRLFRCAREDSNLHGPYSPQGPRPDALGVDRFIGVQSVETAGAGDFVGRICCGGCSHGVLTGAERYARLVGRVDEGR